MENPQDNKSLASKNWYLLQCKSREEARAQQHISNQGYRTYFPQAYITKKKQGRHQAVLEPLFPGYLFIELDPDTANFNALRSTRGVLRFVRFGSYPSQVSASLIHQLQAAEQAQLAAYHSEAGENQGKASRGLPKNTPVTILEGPFAGLEALYDTPEGEQRCFILLEFMGKQQRLLLEEAKLAQLSN